MFIEATGKTGASQTRVLIVDDDAITRTLVAEKVGQFNVWTVGAEDGEQAWDCLQKRSFDLALIDLEMPNMDGFELIQKMSSDTRTKNIPIIVLTGREDKPALEQVLLAGATSCLSKPLNWAALGKNIIDVLGPKLRSGTAEQRKVAC